MSKTGQLYMDQQSDLLDEILCERDQLRAALRLYAIRRDHKDRSGKLLRVQACCICREWADLKEEIQHKKDCLLAVHG